MFQDRAESSPLPVSRLCIIISHLRGGGAERVASGIANYWGETGRDPTLMILADDSEAPAYKIHEKVRYVPLGIASRGLNPVWKLSNVGRLWRLRQTLLAYRPQLVISFIEKVNVTVLLALLGSGVPVVVREALDPHANPIGLVWDFLRACLYPFAARVVVLTANAKGYFSHTVQEKTVVIPPWVETAEAGFNGCSPLLPRPLITAMGRLHRQKGFDLLIRAFAMLAHAYPEWSVVILGEGPERKDLERLVQDVGLEGRVVLPGWRKEAHDVLSQSDLFVFPSRYEGFGQSLAEAMALGLPVIATDCLSGPGAIVRDGIDGRLVPTEDISALATAMDHLMRDKAERERLAARGPEARTRYSRDYVAALWDDLVGDVANN